MTLPEQPTQPGQIPRREFTKEQFAQLVSRAGEFTPEQKAQFMAQMNISLGQLLPVVPEGLFTGAYALGLENANGLIALYSNWHLLNPHAKRFLELAMEPLSSSAHTTAPQPQSLNSLMQALSIASQEQLPGEPPFVAQQTPSQLSPHATGAYGQLSMQQILQSNVPSTPVITGNSTINSIVDEQNKAIMKAMSKIREDTTLDDLYAQARLESPGLATGNHDVDKLIAQLKTKYATNGPNFDTSSLNPQQPGDVDVESIIAQFDTNYATNGPGFDTSTFDPQQLGDAVQEAFGMLLGGI